jgi:hypothetical protein
VQFDFPPAEYVIGAQRKQVVSDKPYPGAHSLHVVSSEQIVQFSEQFVQLDELSAE